MLPLISFETGRKTQTQSSGRLEGLRQQMEVWFYGNRNHGCEANTRGEKSRKNLHPRSSVARRESFCPLSRNSR